MGGKEKLIARLKSKPKDFTFDEMQCLLELLGFEILNKRKASGSRVLFKNGNIPINLHKPHPRKEFLEYQIMYVLDVLEREGLI
jgi:hypothetical protein